MHSNESSNNTGYSWREKIKAAQSYEEALVLFNQAYVLGSERTIRRCKKLIEERWPKSKR